MESRATQNCSPRKEVARGSKSSPASTNCGTRASNSFNWWRNFDIRSPANFLLGFMGYHSIILGREGVNCARDKFRFWKEEGESFFTQLDMKDLGDFSISVSRERWNKHRSTLSSQPPTKTCTHTHTYISTFYSNSSTSSQSRSEIVNSKGQNLNSPETRKLINQNVMEDAPAK